MFKPLCTGVVVACVMAAPSFAAELADLPDCLKPRTLSSVTDTVVKEQLIAQAGSIGDPACTYRVAIPQPVIPEEVPVRGLW